MRSIEAQLASLVSALESGGFGSDSMEELGALWAGAFQNSIAIRDADPDCRLFISHHLDIRLRGVDELHCWVFAGGPARVLECIKWHWSAIAVPGRISVAIVPTSAKEAARTALHTLRFVVIDSDGLRTLLTAASPSHTLTAFIRQSIPIRSLIPFTTLHSAQGNMFYGRQVELDRLIEEEEVSFAIAGPGRIGKTSLMKQYARLLVERRDPRMHSRRYVDFYECSNKSEGGFVHFLATKIDGTRRSFEVGPQDLPNFLRRLRHSLGATPQLLLDEVDEICHLHHFGVLAEEAKLGICRMILCGRGNLLREMLNNKQLGGRLALLRLEPLDNDSATRLLMEPLLDLGFEITKTDRLVQRVLQFTGRLPHLVQFCGRKLAELAVEQGATTISESHLDILRWDFELVQYFTSPLDLSSKLARFAAFSLLQEESDGPWSIAHVQANLARNGVLVSLDEAKDVCNDLTINNILAWVNGHFRIANEALAYYARETEYLQPAFQEARREVKRTR